MTEMLEKAARAAVTAEQDQWDLPAEEWDFETLERHGLIKIARAVLMAVRDGLTDDVIEAGRLFPGNDEMPEMNFTAMIDAILAQEPGS